MENLPLITSLVTLGAVLVTIVIGIRKPNEDQNSRIITLENGYKDFSSHLLEIKSDFRLLKENDLKHIELEMGKVNITITQIETILKERLPKSSNGFKK